MVTVAHLVKKKFFENPNLEEALRQDILSHPKLAQQWHNFFESELGKSIKLSAIIMAIRRYQETTHKNSTRVKSNHDTDITLQGNMMDICIQKNLNISNELQALYKIINLSKGENINIIHGHTEMSVVTHAKYEDKVLKILKSQTVLSVERDLVSLSLKLGGDFLHTPGIIFNLLRPLVWNNINIYEIVSTNTELNLILHKRAATKAYQTISEFIEKRKE